jgi:serine/threonine protein kinase/Flp pilus assembly protein TadD
MIGQSIRQYHIIAKLGEGGMGEVFLANDTLLDRQVALKFLPPVLWGAENARERLIQEAKAASKLDHPNVVTIHGLEQADDRPFSVMAHVVGASLTEYCRMGNRTVNEKLDVILQLIDGVAHAHRVGIIHRDLKPSNILVSTDGRVRILDFGIARLHGTARLTQTGSTLGTLAYSSPELIQGQDATVASDIFSLGVVMYEVFAGVLPFSEAHEAALLYAILQERPSPLTDHDPSVPPTLQSCVMRCLEKDPRNRYPSCHELADDLRLVRSGAPVADASSRHAKPSIAILPFVNMSADPENEYFSDGLSEELMNALAKNPALKVTGRTSSFAVKGKQEDLRNIGMKLGVETILEGSVRKSGNRVRITAQLVKAADGFHLWTETYDRVLDDIFAVQDDIAEEVATAMNVTLLGQAPRAERRVDEAYTMILQGKYWVQRLSSEGVAKSIAFFRRAIELEPTNAEAWAHLSRALGQLAGFGFTDQPNAAYTEAKEAAERALELDESLAIAHDVMGWVCVGFTYEWDKAGASFRRAFALEPSSSRALSSLANYQGIMGYLDEAVRLAREAVVLDPLSPTMHRICGRIESWAGFWDDAIATLRRLLELSPDTTAAQGAIALVLLDAGRPEEALAPALLEKSAGYRSCALAAVYHRLGQLDKSDEALQTLLGLGKMWAIQIAYAYALRGEHDAAFQWLNEAYTQRDTGLMSARVHPAFTGLRADPRWREFLRKVGLDREAA